MSKKEKKENVSKKSKSITKLIKDNYAWVIAIATALGVIVINILRFIEYVTANAYFSYYGLNIQLYQYYDQNFLYELCLSIILLCALGSLLYCWKQFTVNLKKIKIFNKTNLYNLALIILSNFYLVFILKIEFKLIWVYFISLLVIEFIMSCIVFKKDKRNYTENFSLKEEFTNFIKYLPFVIIIFIVSQFIKIHYELPLKREYRIIDENKVIVYSNNDYYLTLDCEINGETLIIYKGRQNKIDTTNVYSKLDKFKDIEIK